jgi:hypothetical protein
MSQKIELCTILFGFHIKGVPWNHAKAYFYLGMEERASRYGRVAANILKNQSENADKRWPYRL